MKENKFHNTGLYMVLTMNYEAGDTRMKNKILHKLSVDNPFRDENDPLNMNIKRKPKSSRKTRKNKGKKKETKKSNRKTQKN